MTWRWPTCCRMITQSWRCMKIYDHLWISGRTDVPFLPLQHSIWILSTRFRRLGSQNSLGSRNFDNRVWCYQWQCMLPKWLLSWWFDSKNNRSVHLTSLAMGLKAKLDAKPHQNSSRTSTWIPNQSQSIKLLKLRILHDTSDILSISGKISTLFLVFLYRKILRFPTHSSHHSCRPLQVPEPSQIWRLVHR